MQQKKKQYKLFAHRGAKASAPENTIPAFQKAHDQGTSWVELDIYNVENTLVVFHDYTLDKITNGRGAIEQVPLKYLRSLNAGNGEQVPLLTEVLDKFANKLNFNIELKGSNTAMILNELLKQYIDKKLYSTENFIISSFNHPELQKVDSKFKKGAIYSVIPLDNNEFVSNLNPYSVHVHCNCISEELVEDAHNRGYQIYAYTVNNEIVLDKVIALNVDGIFTDCPDLMINWLMNRKLDYI
jgi:glycerophosphoryl diester phosphodiesterase